MVVQGNKFEIVQSRSGDYSIKNVVNGETLHHPAGPARETDEIYIKPSRLAERLQVQTAKPLVVFDVGLGAGFNALAAVDCFYNTKSARPLEIHSFENDLSLFEFSLMHARHFPLMTKYKNAAQELLVQRWLKNEGLEWTIHLGCFTKILPTMSQPPEIVFFDPYSRNANPEMWNASLFSQIAKLAVNNKCVLLTYSRSTEMRLALLEAGFFVGKGPGFEERESTQASTNREEITEPLGRAWIEKRAPDLLVSHPQFL